MDAMNYPMVFLRIEVILPIVLIFIAIILASRFIQVRVWVIVRVLLSKKCKILYLRPTYFFPLNHTITPDIILCTNHKLIAIKMIAYSRRRSKFRIDGVDKMTLIHYRKQKQVEYEPIRIQMNIAQINRILHQAIFPTTIQDATCAYAFFPMNQGMVFAKNENKPLEHGESIGGMLFYTSPRLFLNTIDEEQKNWKKPAKYNEMKKQIRVQIQELLLEHHKQQ